jgi:hypothetical protein
MRTSLLAFLLVNLTASGLLAQTPPPVVSVGESADGPLLAPPTIDVPNTAGAPLPPPPAASNEPKSKPRFFRLPQPQPGTTAQPGPAAGEANQQGKLLGGRWKQRNAPPLTEAPLANSNANLEAQPIKPQDDAPPAKRANNPRKYGPLELFPKAKESDRAGNPFSLRRPILAW